LARRNIRGKKKKKESHGVIGKPVSMKEGKINCYKNPILGPGAGQKKYTLSLAFRRQSSYERSGGNAE